MPSATAHANFIWSIAERLRGPFMQHQYGSIILPLTLLRRLDQVLEPTKDEVLAQAAKYEGRGLNVDSILKRAAGQGFYNTSKLTLAKVAADADHVADHLRNYVSGFDPVVREIFEAFKFDTTITELNKADRLYSVLGKFLDPDLDLHPRRVRNAVMGDIFEELIRRFAEASNQTAGQHFTPREVVRLCAELVLAGDEELLTKPGIVRSVYDPACGTGGMLSVVEELVRERNPKASVFTFGQELNAEVWAICRAEMLVKGQDPSRISPASTLSADGHEGQRFNLMLANPPFGVDWDDDHDAVIKEHETLGYEGRFGPGTPRKSDGALLFLQTMLAKMKPADEDAGSRIAIIFNGSPLFSGDAGSGESEIRRWLLQPENDWLEAIVALPEQLFYNTGIATYVWVLTNRKEQRRAGKVQLIDARDLWEQMPKSLGDKRRRLSLTHIAEVMDIWKSFDAENERSKVVPNREFGYRKVAVERPLRYRYQAGEGAVERLKTQRGYKSLDDDTKDLLTVGMRALNGLDTLEREVAEEHVSAWLADKDVELTTAARNALWGALSITDPKGEVVRNSRGRLQPDASLREYELVGLDEDIDAYMEREVLPFVDDAWVEDPVGREGYEVPFTRLFYRYLPPRSLAEVDHDLQQVEQEIQRMLDEVTE